MAGALSWSLSLADESDVIVKEDGFEAVAQCGKTEKKNRLTEEKCVSRVVLGFFLVFLGSGDSSARCSVLVLKSF